ncbi:MAG: SpoIIE family protein phosphatase [Acidobacteriia bacterium]|nr:SpoIIE family protein phosphatase [Terriglobia bacterium]
MADAVNLKPSVRPLELIDLLTLLLELSERINSTLDLDELLGRVAEFVKRTIDYEVFAILLYNEKARDLRVRFSLGHPDEVVKSLRVRVGEGIVGRAAETRRSVRVSDVRLEPSYIPSVPSVRSELAVPLIAKNRLIGIVDLEAPWPDFFTEQHQNILELLAGRIAMAIENARLYRRSLRQAKTLQLLNEISRELSSVLSLNDLLRRIGTLTKGLIDYHRFSIMLVDEQSKTLSAVMSLRQDERLADKCTVAFGQGLVGAAVSQRRTIVVPDVSADPRYFMANPETRSEMVVPLIYRDRVIGVLDLESPTPAYFTDDHVRTLSTLAPQIAIAIENARLYERVARSESRMERDLERAREIQLHLMPAVSPVIAGLDVFARFLPAQTLGGDLYDFLTYGRDRHALTVGDVSGKGAPAALYGAMTIGILRSLAPLKPAPPEMLRQLNVRLLERKIEGHFVTLAYSVWEPRTRTLRLANAGMPLPLLVRHGKVKPIRAEGVPLGLLEHAEYQETSVTLEKGDLLALFSDGLEEAAGSDHEEFGVRRLESVLRECAARPLHELTETLFAAIARFEQGRPRRDDQTLLLLRVR